MFNLYRTVLNTQITNIPISQKLQQTPNILQFPRKCQKGTTNSPEKDLGANKQEKSKKGKNKKDNDDNNGGGGGLLQPIIQDLKGWIGKKRNSEVVTYYQ